jgi:hypothetical protein
MLVTPRAPGGLGRDTGRAPTEEATKTAAMLDRLSIDKAIKTSGGSGGSASLSIQVLGSPEWADLI